MIHRSYSPSRHGDAKRSEKCCGNTYLDDIAVAAAAGTHTQEPNHTRVLLPGRESGEDKYNQKYFHIHLYMDEQLLNYQPIQIDMCVFSPSWNTSGINWIILHFLSLKQLTHAPPLTPPPLRFTLSRLKVTHFKTDTSTRGRTDRRNNNAYRKSLGFRRTKCYSQKCRSAVFKRGFRFWGPPL